MPDLVESKRTCETEDAPAVVARLMRDASDQGASDLHFDPGPEFLAVRIRRDGVLRTIERLPADLGPKIVGRCKSLGELLVYRQDLPQEGRVPSDRAEANGRDVRVATYPTMHGERVALRFQAPHGAPSRIADLGLDPRVQHALTEAVEQPDGVLLLTGPSGSGKTTTLYSCLHHLANAETERTIITVEDPVERRIDGVVQTEVSEAAGLDFSRALRSLLRQDPDVLMLGEIRDRETAAIALEAGLTGHLVASTVHAGSAPEVFARLLEMDVEPFVLTTTVRGVLAQRLLRQACSYEHECGGAACQCCRGTGYSGRVLLAEWLPMNDELRGTVLGRRDGRALAEAARSSEFDSLMQAAARLVADGKTDHEEVRRVLGRHR